MPFLSSLKNSISKAGSTKLFLSLLFIIAIVLNLTQVLDTSSKQHIDKAFNRALITFSIAKTLNGVISVAQGTEIAIQPAGIGINLTPGQILDPVNDLVERFSWIMLMSTTSLGIQKVFLTMSVWPEFSYLMIAFLALGLILLFTKTRKHVHLRILILRISLLFIIIRFAVPFSGLANEFVYRMFLENEYITSTKTLETTAQEIGQLNEIEQYSQLGNKKNSKKKNSFWQSAKDLYNSTADTLDINKRIEKYKQAATETTRHIVSLIVVFLFQTIIIPLGFIFLIYAMFKYIVNLNFKT
ncbi:MAG: hypothetical protein KAT06_06470 [Gammaproteobacteria bacterium]|nr:hypothetical protein [Gammaproteobacteria bacterium]